MSRAEYYLIGAARGGSKFKFETLAAMLPKDDYEVVASRHVYARGSVTEGRDESYPGTCQDVSKITMLLHGAAENKERWLYGVEPFRIPLKKGFIEFQDDTSWGEYSWNANSGLQTIRARVVAESSVQLWTRAALELFEDMKTTTRFVVFKDYDEKAKTWRDMEYTPVFHVRKDRIGVVDGDTKLLNLAFSISREVDARKIFKDKFGPDWYRLDIYDLMRCVEAHLKKAE